MIAAETNCKVICDFRIQDVALNGQGAPLVPIGDKLLFNDYDFCLNLGGFANISFADKDQRVAFDICPVNIILNHIAALRQKDFDDQGALGRAGLVDNSLLKELNDLHYYRLSLPKSLSREWMEREFLPLLEQSGLSPEDKAATVYKHISEQLMKVFNQYQLNI